MIDNAGESGLEFVPENCFAVIEYVPSPSAAILFVEMFFPLSGFILGPQVLKVVRESRNFPTFLVRRWMRTLPLYFLGLAGVAVLTHNFGVAEFWKYFTFIKFVNGQYADNNFYSIAWSLAVEEYYYILFPLVLMLPGDRVKEKTIAFLAIGLIVKH